MPRDPQGHCLAPRRPLTVAQALSAHPARVGAAAHRRPAGGCPRPIRRSPRRSGVGRPAGPPFQTARVPEQPRRHPRPRAPGHQRIPPAGRHHAARVRRRAMDRRAHRHPGRALPRGRRRGPHLEGRGRPTRLRGARRHRPGALPIPLRPPARTAPRSQALVEVYEVPKTALALRVARAFPPVAPLSPPAPSTGARSEA